MVVVFVSGLAVESEAKGLRPARLGRALLRVVAFPFLLLLLSLLPLLLVGRLERR